MQIEQDFFIGIQDVGVNNEITNKAILEALTNATNMHGNVFNQGITKLGETNITWLILNWKLEVYKRPKICEKIIVKTWVKEYNKFQANRDFEVFDKNKELIARATSKWLSVNTQTGKIEKITESRMEPYVSKSNYDYFDNYEFEKIDENKLQTISETKFKICKSMIDYNNHVHNTSYLDIALEGLPKDLDKINFANVEICYKKEIKPDKEVSIKYAKKEDKNYILIKDSEEKQLHSVIILY